MDDYVRRYELKRLQGEVSLRQEETRLRRIEHELKCEKMKLKAAQGSFNEILNTVLKGRKERLTPKLAYHEASIRCRNLGESKKGINVLTRNIVNISKREEKTCGLILKEKKTLEKLCEKEKVTRKELNLADEANETDELSEIFVLQSKSLMENKNQNESQGLEFREVGVGSTLCGSGGHPQYDQLPKNTSDQNKAEVSESSKNFSSPEQANISCFNYKKSSGDRGVEVSVSEKGGRSYMLQVEDGGAFVDVKIFPENARDRHFFLSQRKNFEKDIEEKGLRVRNFMILGQKKTMSRDNNMEKIPE